MRSYAAPVLLLALGIGLSTGLGACSGDEPRKPEAGPTATPTPLSAFDSTAVTLARADFCGLIPDSAAEEALGAPVAKRSDYGNGERAEVARGVRDVAHEFSCSYSAADGATARAWVFAPQVTEKRARGLVRDLHRRQGCKTPTADGFGTPSVLTVCRAGAGTEAAYHGLFVDAWLSCSVTSGKAAAGTARADLLARTGRWCVQVATAVDTSAS